MINILLVVTGASKGLGRAIAVAFHSEAASPACCAKTILISRSQDGLEQTKQLISDAQNQHAKDTSEAADQQDVLLHIIDLGDLDHLDENIDTVLKQLEEVVNERQIDRLVFVNNAGSLGKLGPCWESRSLAEMKQAVDLNVTSSLWISVRFARFAAERWPHATTIVNISSLAAIQPLPSMGIYSAGKAARDMFHACLTKELEGAADNDNSNVKVLNYAPGPLETDMTTELRQCPDLDKTLKPNFDKQLVDPDESARALVRLVLKNEFTSGSHIDFYDCSTD